LDRLVAHVKKDTPPFLADRASLFALLLEEQCWLPVVHGVWWEADQPQPHELWYDGRRIYDRMTRQPLTLEALRV
jgi:hypothetical protein